MPEADYRKYYALERYLFEEVTARFKKNAVLDAFDLFCIVVWKANRAKSRIAERLLSKGYDDLESATNALTTSIAQARDDKARMKLLIVDWRFRLPMASAVLTVLYPDTFTVYDVRVCNVLDEFHNVQNRSDFDNLWSGYQDFVQAVRKKVKEKYALRDKDRWLWGKSFCEQLKKDIEEKFES